MSGCPFQDEIHLNQQGRPRKPDPDVEDKQLAIYHLLMRSLLAKPGSSL